MPASENDGRAWPYALGLVVCLFIGLVLGVVFSAAAFAIYLVRGSAPFDEADVTIGSAIAVYLAGFITAGAVAGILNPLARSKGGAVVVGVLATIPLAGLASFVLEGHFLPYDVRTLAITATQALVFGGPVGYMAWREFVGRRTHRSGV